MKNPTTNSGRYGAAKDPFATVVYVLVGVAAVVEFFSLFWMDLL